MDSSRITHGFVYQVSDSWTGNGADNLWSDPNNWSGDVAPTAAADLVFRNGALQKTSVNDLGLAFDSVTVADNYSFSGQLLNTGTLTVNQGILDLACSLQLAGSGTVASNATLSAQGILLVNGVLDASGKVEVASGGTLVDSGNVLVESAPCCRWTTAARST